MTRKSVPLIAGGGILLWLALRPGGLLSGGAGTRRPPSASDPGLTDFQRMLITAGLPGLASVVGAGIGAGMTTLKEIIWPAVTRGDSVIPYSDILRSIPPVETGVVPFGTEIPELAIPPVEPVPLYEELFSWGEILAEGGITPFGTEIPELAVLSLQVVPGVEASATGTAVLASQFGAQHLDSLIVEPFAGSAWPATWSQFAVPLFFASVIAQLIIRHFFSAKSHEQRERLEYAEIFSDLQWFAEDVSIAENQNEVWALLEKAKMYFQDVNSYKPKFQRWSPVVVEDPGADRQLSVNEFYVWPLDRLTVRVLAGVNLERKTALTEFLTAVVTRQLAVIRGWEQGAPGADPVYQEIRRLRAGIDQQTRSAWTEYQALQRTAEAAQYGNPEFLLSLTQQMETLAYGHLGSGPLFKVTRLSRITGLSQSVLLEILARTYLYQPPPGYMQ